MTPGQRIRKARNWRGWSLRKLAAAAGCDASTIGAIEADENEPGVFVMMRIANALVDGRGYLLFPSAQDHKRALDGDLGLNTGGMGTFSPR